MSYILQIVWKFSHIYKTTILFYNTYANDVTKEYRIERETGRREIQYRDVRHCAHCATADGRHVPRQCPKQRKSPTEIFKLANTGWWLPLFRARTNNMAPKTYHQCISLTNHPALFWANISLFFVTTLRYYCAQVLTFFVWWTWYGRLCTQ